ncbi:quinolinate synthase NadA [Virgibacillus ndiopensis]|uniref:quinolinate synthase NadA n=1 Tax=Virgibacillus ndiopensis TaxID=2004408 RepID=UPI000C087E31|nr:quinolinate synthase NadA [Virgibacillus ndiopensis]
MNILEEMKQRTDVVSIPEHYKQMTMEEMKKRVIEIKAKLGKQLYLPCHHYQKDEVVQFADDIGDSLKLAQLSAQNKEAKFIVFCGVHFMAETADMLTEDRQVVLLPDMRAGCSMADMADMHQTDRCWSVLQNTFGDTILPLTYVNSTAAIKAFVGRNGGATVTSSNAKRMLEWAFTQKERVLFLPDQHLGRNTAYNLDIPLDKMAVWDPINHCFEYDGNLEEAKIILWKGHCSVHQNFTAENVEEIRKTKPDMNIIVHPECPFETVELSDYAGATSFIINTIENAPSGSKWAIGTEMNLVQRIIDQHPDKEICSLNPHMCPCMTMNRIDLPHLLWSLESIERGETVNQVTVSNAITTDAVLALNRMLERA